MMSGLGGAILWTLAVAAVCALLFWAFVIRELGTVVGRATWRHDRALARRTAELIERGFDAYTAKNLAEAESRREALAATRELEKAGVEKW